MHYDPDRHHRRSIRLRGYDYAQQGAYFVTICVRDRECLLGEVVNGGMILSEVGQAIERVWKEISDRFPFVLLDACVLMPNHLHGILVFVHLENPSDAALPTPDREGAASSAPTSCTPEPVVLGSVLRAFKSVSAIAANRLLGRKERPFWQRNYYERIIRDEREMEQIRTYIYLNPAQWASDTENPATFPAS